MTRYEERGCTASRSFRCFRSLALPRIGLRWMLALAVVASFTGYVWAQDDNVHVEPRPTPDPTAKAATDTEKVAKDSKDSKDAKNASVKIPGVGIDQPKPQQKRTKMQKSPKTRPKDQRMQPRRFLESLAIPA